MSQTDAGELLAAVRDFLRCELLPQLEGFSAYNARVAANSLEIVARELQLGPELEAIDRVFAEQRGIDTDAGPVERQLALALRDGRLVLDEELFDYLRRRTMKKMAIDNPRYSAYRRAMGQ